MAVDALKMKGGPRRSRRTGQSGEGPSGQPLVADINSSDSKELVAPAAASTATASASSASSSSSTSPRDAQVAFLLDEINTTLNATMADLDTARHIVNSEVCTEQCPMCQLYFLLEHNSVLFVSISYLVTLIVIHLFSLVIAVLFFFLLFFFLFYASFLYPTDSSNSGMCCFLADCDSNAASRSQQPVVHSSQSRRQPGPAEASLATTTSRACCSCSWCGCR